MDPTTRFDEGRVRYSPGDLIVRGDNAYVAATLDDGWHTSILVGIDGDAIGDEGSNRGYGFKRWNVVTGTGTEKVVLAEVTDQTVALKI
ncbi:hypothetical protein [Novosphingobium sp. PhB165]|uniref:hypothetical protein n=1 Tax=Novosphingobium sp. PhB165 TaxID=2485105 RepID=UPI00104BA82D|nr:hypothetical protein [Novosphingobium sp. PhB165]